jgi:hypothetical protein
MHAPVLRDRSTAIRDVDSIRQYLKARAPAKSILPEKTDGRSTGIAAIDRLLEGGLPKGAITVLTGPAGTGRMTIAASALAVETRAKKPVAWVDARGTLYPPALAQAGVDLSRMLMVRGVRERALFAIEQILETGAFGLVVASGLEASLSSSGMRRVQTASEKTGASTLFVLEPHASAAITNAALKLKLVRTPSAIQIEIEKARYELVGHRASLEIKLGLHREAA